MDAFDALHPDLRQGLDRLGIADRVRQLARNSQESQQTLQRVIRHVQTEMPTEAVDPGLDVVVFGSYARGEASTASDFDYLVLVHSLPDEQRVADSQKLLAAVRSYVARRLRDGGGSAQPGATGIFGRIASAPDLSERIGLEQDTNVSHTRRLLLLQESTSIYRPELRGNLVKAILRRYLLARPDIDRPPRFLINDFHRYWYTLTVDYQAKRWERNEQDWGLRYLKLISSRKLTYASTLATLLRCGRHDHASVDGLARELDKPALARLAQLALDDDFDQPDALRKVLLFAEHFAEFLADPDKREQARKVESLHGDDQPPVFSGMRQAAREMDAHLKAVFLGDYFGELTRRYMLRELTEATRVNYAVLGNAEPHLHAHLIPRFPALEPVPHRPPWEDPRERRSLGERLGHLAEALGVRLAAPAAAP